MLLAHMPPDAFTELKKGSAETLVLAVLEDGPSHGYELAKSIDRRSAGRLVFHVATLYTTLYRMERAGLIERTASAQWRTCSLRTEPLDEASAWVDRHRGEWNARNGDGGG